MSFWSGEKILNNPSVVDGFDSEQVEANAYNLRMGDHYFVTGNGDDQKKTFLKSRESFNIPPGQFVYLISKEKLYIPKNAMAFISIKTGVKFRGLVNVSGFHVDPGYNGKLIFAAYNASPSPIHITEGENLYKIWFADLVQGSEQTPNFESEHVFSEKGKTEIGSDLIRGMNQRIYSLQDMAGKIEEQGRLIKQLHNVWTALYVGVLIAIFAAVILSALNFFSSTLTLASLETWWEAFWK